MGNEEGEWDRGKEGVQWRSSLTSGGDVSEELWGDGWLGLEEKHMFIVKSTTREQRGNKGCGAYQDGQMSLNQSQAHDDDTLEDSIPSLLQPVQMTKANIDHISLVLLTWHIAGPLLSVSSVLLLNKSIAKNSFQRAGGCTAGGCTTASLASCRSHSAASPSSTQRSRGRSSTTCSSGKRQLPQLWRDWPLQRVLQQPQLVQPVAALELRWYNAGEAILLQVQNVERCQLCDLRQDAPDPKAAYGQLEQARAIAKLHWNAAGEHVRGEVQVAEQPKVIEPRRDGVG
uniref:Uncharacterized protein n=1 Tax=Oryza glumipatula TaxID=40148 RepID=A0A0D9YWD3_9ORYZ